HAAYLLGRLEESKKKEYEAHLKDCPRCREELEKERELTAALKKAGREEMKAEIRRQVKAQEPVEKGFDWTMVLKAAAVFFFLITIPALYYYSRHSGGEPAKPAQMEVQRREKKQIIPEEEIGKMVPSQEKGDIQTETDVSSLQVDEDGGQEVQTKKSSTGKGEIAVGNTELEIRQFAVSDKIPLIVENGMQGSSAVKITHPEKEKKKAVELFTFAGGSGISRPPDIPSTSNLSESAKDRGASGFFETFSKSQSGGQRQKKPLQVREQAHSAADSPVWFFKSGKQILEIHPLVTAAISTDSVSGFPLSFKIEQTGKDSLRQTMHWYVNRKIVELDPSRITIQTMGKDSLQISFGRQWVYVTSPDGKMVKAELKNK
ncbi:MAG: anti-sigma factor family protein, partial [Calditrichia bacterium]